MPRKLRAGFGHGSIPPRGGVLSLGVASASPLTSSISLSVPSATGGSGDYLYQWQRSLSESSGFSDLAGVTSTSASDDTISLDQTYYYRATVFDLGSGTTEFEDFFTGTAWRSHEPAGYVEATDHPFDSTTFTDWNGGGDSDIQIISDPTAIQSPSNVAEVLFAQGMGSTNPISYKYTTLNAKEFYVSFAFKISSNWQGHDSGINKVHYATGFNKNGGDGNPIFTMVKGKNNETLHWSVARQQTDLSGGAQKIYTWDHAGNEVSPSSADAEIVRGQWHIIEMHIIGNTIDTVETFDGEVHAWLDGTKILQFTSEIMWYADHEDDGTFTNLRFEPYFGGQDDTVEQDMWHYYDHIFVSRPS